MTSAPAEADASVRTGTIAAVAAYTMWGFFPIYFLVLRDVAAPELLIHRILFAVPFGAAIVLLRRQGAEVRAALRTPHVLGSLVVSAGFIAANWLVYIVAVQTGYVLEASLGYYINPLIYVLVGVVVLGERLSRGQLVAVVLATIGVLILTAYGGRFPWISLILATSFAVYGYVRKTARVGAMPGLFVETLILAPLAAAGLAWMLSRGTATIGDADAGLTALLMLAGPLTVMPLLCFAIGARRLTLATLGFLQFIGPTIQFAIGVANGEAFTPAHQLCFGFIWTAAAVYAWDAWGRRAVRPAVA